MRFLKFLSALLLLVRVNANAQFDTGWNVMSNNGTQRIIVSNYTSVSEAKSIINQIITVMHLKVNFEVREANVPNAGAVFYNHKRYILYNPNFIKQIDRATGTDWAGISILAHEIGHHVKGHVFANNGGTSHQNELEADEFSGIVLKRMGATLEDAQIAMRMIPGDVASVTHPAKADRLDAIAKGWNDGTVNNDIAKARENVSNVSVASVTTANVVTKQEVTRQSLLADKYILVDVNFSVDKQNEYFVTVEKNIVKWDGNKLTMIGKLASLKSEDYPFYIYDSQKNYVLVSKSGYLVNEKGKNVGYLSMHTAAATASR